MLKIPFVVSHPRPHLDDSSKERCQRINDLLEDDHGFPHLSTVEFLTNVGLILARVEVELVNALLEAGTV